ncbi:MAG TPA: acetoin utilization protein AcuC, partial [Candidatus Limnocylindrales bacterium]|nr:acetoin utilization protein AcuC [Candidatus Limnocylindrales bacterium]
MTRSDVPLLVYGPWSDRYDFGDQHPLTPLRFGPGIDLLRLVGATIGIAPEPASDDDLLLCHTRRYLEIVRRFAADPGETPVAGIGLGGDCPPFADMHAISGAVAGGSLRAVEAILRGQVKHAFHPGGGLHHAMAERASGFCIYNDPALAIARARRDGKRVLYIDLDTHHGDGVQALHADDAAVLTFSIHESGRYLFPGTGHADELGTGAAAGTSVNVPLEPWTGEGPWLAAVSALVPELAACFGADLVVSQHGCDSHAWDPLAHLRVTTTAMGAAARLVDAVAHRWSGGRWLATGGGGYDIYRVVPRAWALTWLAGAHRAPPSDTLPAEWRERWDGPADRRGMSPLPAHFDDPPNAGLPHDDAQVMAELRSAELSRAVRRAVVPRLVREAVDRGWWDPLAAASAEVSPSPAAGPIVFTDAIDTATLGPLSMGERVSSPLDPAAAKALLLAALGGGAGVTAAVAGREVVGIVVSTPGPEGRRT